MNNGNLINIFNLSSTKVSPVLTLHDAIALFDKLADMQDIPYFFLRDGCYARTHIMCQRLIEDGFVPQKAWVFETDMPLTTNHFGAPAPEWHFRVAPALAVLMPDGTSQKMIFDPSLFDGPVSPQEMLGALNATPQQFQITPLGVIPKGYKGDYFPGPEHGICTNEKTDTHARNILNKYLFYRTDEPRPLIASESRKILAESEDISTHGQTWITMTEATRQNTSLTVPIFTKGR